MRRKKDYRQISCLAKVKYPTFAVAQSENQRVFEQIGSVMNVYKCLFCSGFHLGHRKGRIQDEVQERAAKKLNAGIHVRLVDPLDEMPDLDSVTHASMPVRHKKSKVKMNAEKKLLKREYRKQLHDYGEEEGGDYRGE